MNFKEYMQDLLLDKNLWEMKEINQATSHFTVWVCSESGKASTLSQASSSHKNLFCLVMFQIGEFKFEFKKKQTIYIKVARHNMVLVHK